MKKKDRELFLNYVKFSKDFDNSQKMLPSPRDHHRSVSPTEVPYERLPREMLPKEPLINQPFFPHPYVSAYQLSMLHLLHPLDYCRFHHLDRPPFSVERSENFHFKE